MCELIPHLMLVEVDKVNKGRNLGVVQLRRSLLHYLNFIFIILFNILFIVIFNTLFNILFNIIFSSTSHLRVWQE